MSKYTHWLAWVDIRQVCFELLHSPVLVTIDGLVTVLLVGCPDDKGNRTVHNTLIHDSKPFVSDGKQDLDFPVRALATVLLTVF